MSDRRYFRGFGGSGGGGGDPNSFNRGDGDGGGLGLTAWDEGQDHQPARDWRKTALVVGLALLSWVATYVGMLELIEANMGDLPIVHKVIIGFSVAMLMTMVVWLLDQIFQPINLMAKLLYFGGYLFLTIISVGFGFGFYWKVLESRSEGTRGAESAISSVQAPLQTAEARLESLQNTLTRLKDMSQSKAETERTTGTSCPNSKPGDGPRRKLRDDDAGRFAFASDFVKDRIGQVKADMSVINADLAKIVQDDKSILDKAGTRNEFMKALGRKLDGTVTNFNAFRGDPQLKQIRADLADRSDKSQFVDGAGKTFACPDQQLSTMIRSVVASIDALPVLEKPKIITVEGSDATIEAFRRLTTTFYGVLSFKLPPSTDELRELQKKAMSQAEANASGHPAPAITEQAGQGGLSKRDYVPLAIAVFVDLCLLLVSMGKSKSRLQSLVPKMREAERGPVIQILSRFNEIHRDRQIRENFEIFRHVVFDFNGDYYAAIPLIAPYSVDRRRPNAYSPADVEALQQEAHLLANFFTSFERERLFSRVMMPLIPTSRIQKKLWSQGSKFAHAEAFRLYKFKDGAWQELILGAIMGAAKRVEAEKRTRRVENDVFARHTPSFGTSDGAQAEQVQTKTSPLQSASTSAVAAGLREPRIWPPFGASDAAGRPTGPRSPAADTTAFNATAAGPSQTGQAEDFRPGVAPPPPAAEPRDAPQPKVRASEPTAPDFTILAAEPANHNTATVEPPARAAADPARTIEVEATERSVTYRMTPEAMPRSLKAAIEDRLATQPVDTASPMQALEGPTARREGLETTVILDGAESQGVDAEMAEALGGGEPPELPAWNVEMVLPEGRDASKDDVATMARRFGLKREHA